MRSFLFCFTLLLRVFSQELNYAPKIENSSEEKPLVVIIPSYNNEKFYEGNLKSVFSQNYKNFRVIYTNDSSTDRTGELVQQFVEEFGDGIDFIFVDTEENGGPMCSTYNMVHMCEKNEIVVVVDGDDKLSHDDVLKRINQAYLSDKVWMTYGLDHCRIKHNGHSKPTPMKNLRDGTFRKLRYRWSHIRTFYAGLFQSVDKERWMHEGRFFPIGGDIAVICNLLDMAHEHVYYIDEVLYDYNMDNPLNDFRRDKYSQYWYRKYIMALLPLKKLYSKDDFLL